jgi:hypothetical protein
MFRALVALGLLIGQAAEKKSAPPAAASDRIALKDGAVVLGQVVNQNERGKLVFVVRRAWADARVPEQSKAWRAYETPWLKRARAERLRRLQTWREQRLAGMNAAGAAIEDDELLRLLAADIEHLRNLSDDDELPPLMMVALDRKELLKVDRRPENLARLMRQAWNAALADAEEMTPADLRDALEARNVPLAGNDPASVDDLLPLPIETEARWNLRRGATEAMYDKSVWFARFGDMLMPESAAGQGASLTGMLPGLLRSLTGEGPAEDPLPAKLRTLAASGRNAAVVTQLEFADDLAGVRVMSVLWLRGTEGGEGWQPTLRQVAAARGGENAAGVEANLNNDPQVRGIFDVVEGLGLGDVAPEMKQRALAIGGATQRALGQAKGALNEDISALALPFGGR